MGRVRCRGNYWRHLLHTSCENITQKTACRTLNSLPQKVINPNESLLAPLVLLPWTGLVGPEALECRGLRAAHSGLEPTSRPELSMT
jgi:hypothetical protein